MPRGALSFAEHEHHVLARRVVAHVTVGIDVAGEEREPLRPRQSVHPVRDALRVRVAAESVQVEEFGERRGTAAAQA